MKKKAARRAPQSPLLALATERQLTIELLERLLVKALEARAPAPILSPVGGMTSVSPSLDLSKTWGASISGSGIPGTGDAPHSLTRVKTPVLDAIQSSSGMLSPDVHDIPSGAYFFGANEPSPE